MKVDQENQQASYSEDVSQTPKNAPACDPSMNQPAPSPSALKGSQSNSSRAPNQQSHDRPKGSYLYVPQTPQMPWTPRTPQAPLPSHLHKSPAAPYISPLFAQSTSYAAPTSTDLPPFPSAPFYHESDAGPFYNPVIAEDECIDNNTNYVRPAVHGWDHILLNEARRLDPRIATLEDMDYYLAPHKGGTACIDNDIKIPKDDIGRLILLVKKDCIIGYHSSSEGLNAEEMVRAMPFIQVEGNLRMQITGPPQKKRKRNADDHEDGCKDKRDNETLRGGCDAPSPKRPVKRVRIPIKRSPRRQPA
ncbi:hypothetical protein F4774DRAFT_424036 [Daldinia eschscholtzii]|nr:hypothetical protein F4774DRAFT_424036 [Daldinia eschscholtzii]